MFVASATGSKLNSNIWKTNLWRWKSKEWTCFWKMKMKSKTHTLTLKTLPPNERHTVKDFERLRNLANGQDPNEGMSEIDMVIKELEEEERENQNQPGPEN